MRRFFLVALTLCFVLAAATDAWSWGSVTGPRGGTAYRGPFGGGAYHGPNGGSAYRGPWGRAYARGPNGGFAYRGPYGGGVARGPNGNYAYRGPTTYNYNVYRYRYGVVTPGVAAGVAAGVAVGTAVGVSSAYATPTTSYYPSPYYCPFDSPSCAPGAATAGAAEQNMDKLSAPCRSAITFLRSAAAFFPRRQGRWMARLRIMRPGKIRPAPSGRTP